MNYRYLGNSGFKVCELTYGNWLTHGSQIDDETATATVRAALDGGITSFDTADVYANLRAEEVLGEALKGERREGLEIFTKVYWPVAERKPNDHGLSRKHIMDSINGSLRRLKTDYVDLYQAHRFDFETPLEETMVAFSDIVRSGKALYIGVSEWTAAQIQEAAVLAKELRIQLVSNQPQYSMLWRVIEAEVVPTSIELGLSQIVWSPMAQGVLSGKYLPGASLPVSSRASDAEMRKGMEKFLANETLEAVQKLQPIAADMGLNLAQLALAWVLQNQNVASAIVGASNPEQMAQNLKAVGVKIPDTVMIEIDAITRPVAQFDPALTKSPEQRLV